MTFKAIKDFIGLDGLIFTLLVYGVYPYITKNDLLSPSVT